MNDYVESLKRLVLERLADENVGVFLFGSRARGDENRTSDIDIGLLTEKLSDIALVSKLRDEVDEMNIPYKVDLVDLSSADDAFKKKVLGEAQVWKSLE